jgi:hypothetical protein
MFCRNWRLSCQVWHANIEFSIFTQVLGGNVDVRPWLDKLKALDAENIPKAWQLQKEKMKREFEKPAAAPSNTLGSTAGLLLAKLFGKRDQNQPGLVNRKNFIEIIEDAAKQERLAVLKHIESSKEKIEQLRKEQQEMMLKHIEDNKKKNFKLIDYLMGTVPTIPEQPESTT